MKIVKHIVGGLEKLRPADIRCQISPGGMRRIEKILSPPNFLTSVSLLSSLTLWKTKLHRSHVSWISPNISRKVCIMEGFLFHDGLLVRYLAGSDRVLTPYSYLYWFSLIRALLLPNIWNDSQSRLSQESRIYCTMRTSAEIKGLFVFQDHINHNKA